MLTSDTKVQFFGTRITNLKSRQACALPALTWSFSNLSLFEDSKVYKRDRMEFITVIIVMINNLRDLLWSQSRAGSWLRRINKHEARDKRMAWCASCNLAPCMHRVICTRGVMRTYSHHRRHKLSKESVCPAEPGPGMLTGINERAYANMRMILNSVVCL